MVRFRNLNIFSIICEREFQKADRGKKEIFMNNLHNQPFKLKFKRKLKHILEILKDMYTQ
jgi:hypothetical protein